MADLLSCGSRGRRGESGILSSKNMHTQQIEESTAPVFSFNYQPLALAKGIRMATSRYSLQFRSRSLLIKDEWCLIVVLRLL